MSSPNARLIFGRGEDGEPGKDACLMTLILTGVPLAPAGVLGA